MVRWYGDTMVVSLVDGLMRDGSVCACERGPGGLIMDVGDRVGADVRLTHVPRPKTAK